MPVPHILAGTAGGTTAQFDANWAYLGSVFTAASGRIALGTTDPTVGNGRMVVRHNTAEDGGFVIDAGEVTTSPTLYLRNGLSSLPASLKFTANGLQFVDNNGVIKGEFDGAGNLRLRATGTPPTLTASREVAFNVISNTQFRISVRGTDGVTRVANLTLA